MTSRNNDAIALSFVRVVGVSQRSLTSTPPAAAWFPVSGSWSELPRPRMRRSNDQNLWMSLGEAA
ncbi:hypothetical protein I553_1404 [Mycobacterium xenopi 4042]|uniref:Uncharacterized protein n=1 Tax=Mycobacterium xenopi 4042 TaxID=1299334 RepID=X8CFC5_MYCXE|nr:hypothetical protein I553_1404 [Mycobacterium xenopi 4042]